MSRSILVTTVAIGLLAGRAEAKVIVAPLTPHHPPAGMSYPATEKTATVTVTDERADKSFIAAGLLGPGAEKDKGVYLAYATQKDGDLTAFMEAAAREAVTVLGLKAGDGMRLTIAIKEFHVDMYRFSGFSAMNCMGYGVLGVTLTDANGARTNKPDMRLAYFDFAVPKTSMKQVVEKAVSRIYTLAAWQATAQTLVEAYSLAPGSATLDDLSSRIEAERDEDQAREVVFWLGLSGRGSDPVKATLLDRFAKSKKQKVYQTVAETMGLLAIADASGDIHDLLAGKRKIGSWDVEDLEQVWYLIHTLGLLGEKDLQARMPTGKLRMATKVQDLIRFHEMRASPAPSVALQKMMDKARLELVKERR